VSYSFALQKCSSARPTVWRPTSTGTRWVLVHRLRGQCGDINAIDGSVVPLRQRDPRRI